MVQVLLEVPETHPSDKDEPMTVEYQLQGPGMWSFQLQRKNTKDAEV